MAARLLTLLAGRPWHLTVAALAAGLALSERLPNAAVPLAALASILLAISREPGAAVLAGSRPRGARTREAVEPARASAHPQRLAQPLALATLALAAGVTLGSARLAALDAPAERIADAAPLAARAQLLSHPRPSAFGSSAELRLDSGPLRGTRLLARLPRWGQALDADPIGAELRVHGRLRSLTAIAAMDRQREFQVAPWLRHRQLAGELLVEDARLVRGRRGGLAGLLDRIRVHAERGIAAGLSSEQAALLRGMVLGQDEQIPKPQRDEFQAAGLSHILAVSGQNVMLLTALALPVLIASGLGFQARGLVLLGLIALYVPLAGAGPSLLRAGVMGAAGIAALLAARPASRWYALLLAAAVTLTLDPRAWSDPGWQLSFAAVGGILLLGGPLAAGLQGCLRAFQPRRSATPASPSAARSGTLLDEGMSPAVPNGRALGERLLTAFLDGVAITLAATLATAPLLAHHFGTISLAALPANLLALPLVAPAMWVGMLKAAAGQLTLLDVPGNALASLLAPLVALPLDALTLLAERGAELPGAQLPLRLGAPAALAAAYALLGAAVLVGRAGARGLIARAGMSGAQWRRLAPARRAALVTMAVALVALGLVAALAPPGPPRALTVRFLDVGQGDATLIQHPDGTAILFDGGPPEAGITRLLRRAGVRRLALVVATHMSRDHHGGLRSVLASLPVDLLLDGGDGTRDHDFRAVEAEADRRGVRRLPALAPLDIHAGGLRVRVLSPAPRPPGPPPEDPNPRAVTAIVSAGDFDLLLSGDAESPTLRTLALPDVDAIKVPHHGSSDPGLPAVLRQLRPELAGIEVGRGNTYGHPAPETLAALRAAGVRTYRTDRDGTVSVTVRDGAMHVDTER